MGAGQAGRARDEAVKEANLTARLQRHIRAHGPLTIAAFMAMALHDPVAGYYARRQPIGAAGDFVTAPEISQIFGELIGLWCADLWQRMGRPDPVIVAELGPGRGALMADFLRAVAGAPGFREAIRLHLVEASQVLRAEQRRHLGDAEPVWLSDIGALPEGPLLLVANEFLDALPIRQLVRGRAHWAERVIALDDEGRLCFAHGPESPALTLLVPPLLRDSSPGSIAEISPAAAALAVELAERLKRHSGAALLIDYGCSEARLGSTLAAVGEHRAAGILDAPGSADLSAHVDFASFAAAVRSGGAEAYGPVTQGAFLTALGAELRLAALLRRAAPGQRAALESGLSRLIDPAEMGTLFKVLAVTAPGAPVPDGFGDRVTP
ncbi:MAG TPA: SAM-dependent methyltransferase [Stellaceae bacterium]|nr:SAM-dependent methyltransferase [Stellaceae bacterium]